MLYVKEKDVHNFFNRRNLTKKDIKPQCEKTTCKRYKRFTFFEEEITEPYGFFCRKERKTGRFTKFLLLIMKDYDNITGGEVICKNCKYFKGFDFYEKNS